ncbi:MAG: hypothetical protein IPM29_27990 [Planctomycetes bacterium]|nr:hypothetical protein [Planctomycetota bacterium]
MKVLATIGRLGLLALLGGCGVFGRAAEESPAQGDAAARATADGSELRTGERTLLQDYQALLEERGTLRDDLAETSGELERQRGRAEAAERDRDRERSVRIAAETEADRLGARVRELEAKVLAMGIEGARREQELLQLRIQVLEDELATLQPAEATLRAAPPGPGDGGGR